MTEGECLLVDLMFKQETGVLDGVMKLSVVFRS